MKKILMYRWASYNYLDIIKHFELMGYIVVENNSHLKSYDVDDEFSEVLRGLIKNDNYEFVFSVNYFSVISNVCNECKVPYVSWSCDSPLISMHNKSVFNPVNRIFLFDYVDYHEFKEMGVENVYYLPLCVDVGRVDGILRNAKDLNNYQNEISFVGSLYERTTYDRIEPELSDYLRGYFECYMELQCNSFKKKYIEAVITPDILAEIEERFNLDKSENSFSDLGLIFSTTVLGFKVARNTRIIALNMLSKEYPVSIYSNSDTEVLPGVNHRGGLDYWSEMPKAFHKSRINLNFTIPNIKSGIPLRCWDVIGSGGFLITSRQSEMDLYFKEGEDIVTFDSIPELMDKVSFYMENNEERNKITLASYEKVKKYHTYDVRLTEMMDILRETL